MGFVKSKSFIFLGLGIIVLFFITRFYNILSLPIFTDEAIYVRWAQVASNDASWRFISLTDGKQPMFVWIAMIFMKFINDPLLAGRLVSVVAGFGTMIGVFFLTNEIFKSPSISPGQARKIALIASLIYVLYPFALVYDRMALYDSLVSMFIVWSLYFEILLVRYMRLDLALILGMIIGGGMLTKTNANFAFILLPFLLILIDFKDKHLSKKIGKLIVFSLAALFIANMMYAILRLSPFFHIVGIKDHVFIYSFGEWIKHPLAYFIGNFRALIEWLSIYTTLPFLVLVAASFLVSKKFLKEKLLLFIWFIVPLIISAFFFKQAYPRHILFMTIPLIILAAYAFYYILKFSKKLVLQVVIFIVFFAMFVVNDYFIVTDFAKARVPQSDLGQYITGWPSGVGVKESIAYLSEQSKSGKIYVGTGGTFGLMPFALEMYFVNNPNVIVKGFWPVLDKPPKEVIDTSKKMPTYFVLYQSCPICQGTGLAPLTWDVSQIMRIEKLEKGSYYTLYKINSR